MVTAAKQSPSARCPVLGRSGLQNPESRTPAAYGLSDRRSKRAQKLLLAGALLWAWEADIGLLAKPAGEQWLILLLAKWNKEVACTMRDATILESWAVLERLEIDLSSSQRKKLDFCRTYGAEKKIESCVPVRDVCTVSLSILE